MAKFEYAKDEDGNILNISDVDDSVRDRITFFCIGCNNELIAKLGKIKTHHFAHKQKISCSGETYLHLLGKQLFFDNYNKCLTEKKPFFIELYQKRNCDHFLQEFGFNCKLEDVLTKFDLTEYFDSIFLESREGQFIPDVKLTSKNGKDKLFVEIAVTHLSSNEKLSSSFRIIEIRADSEDDFSSIVKHNISINNSKVSFVNFDVKELNTSICNGACDKEYNFLSLDRNGRCLLRQRSLNQIKTQLDNPGKGIVKYLIEEITNKSNSNVFKINLARFEKEGHRVKNCFLCRYHAINKSGRGYSSNMGNPIFCKFQKIQCNSNHAVECEYFKLEKDYVDEFIQLGKELEKLYARNPIFLFGEEY